MHKPLTGESLCGDGAKVTWSGLNFRGTLVTHQLRCRPCPTLSEATVMTTSPLLLGEPERLAFGRGAAQARLCRFGGDCYRYGMVAAGPRRLPNRIGRKPPRTPPVMPIALAPGRS